MAPQKERKELGRRITQGVTLRPNLVPQVRPIRVGAAEDEEPHVGAEEEAGNREEAPKKAPEEVFSPTPITTHTAGTGRGLPSESQRGWRAAMERAMSVEMTGEAA